MAIRINKPGILDTIQDAGRYGYQHWGINPGGAMDTIAMRVANILIGNDPSEPVIEMHFPAAEILFEENAMIALAGADMRASVNGQAIPIHQPVLVAKNSVLRFAGIVCGARMYLAVHGGWKADRWLDSASTHLKVKAGGHKGRSLQKNDQLFFNTPINILPQEPCTVLHWKANLSGLYTTNGFRFIEGNEYASLDIVSRESLESGSFTIARQSDRMGYRLIGPVLEVNAQKELISTAVTKGTMQLLPDGQLIVLMADHQTTGGYPRLGHIISADMPSLAQTTVGKEISFIKTDIVSAENYLRQQETNLQQLQNACNFRLKDFFEGQK
jgi:antagonist of KipI